MNTSILRIVALTTTFFTGLSALLYEVTWQYFLSNLLGSQARSTAIILATFLGSLAFGYHSFGKISRRYHSSRLIRLCGALEIGIGLWALSFSVLYSILWQLRAFLQTGTASLSTDLLFAVVLITPPAAAMGATLPLLTQGLSHNVADAPRFHTLIYAFNTLGAFVGSLFSAFFIIPSLGLAGAMNVGAIINLIAGTSLYFVGRSQRVHDDVGEQHEDIVEEPYSPSLDTPTAPQSSSENRDRNIRPYYFQGIAFLAGWSAITLQSVMIRITGLSVGSSIYAFSLVVAVCIVLLAIGAWLFAEKYSYKISLYGIHVSSILGLLGLYLIIPRLPYYTHVVRSLLTSQPPNFWIYYVIIFLGLSLILALPIASNGAILPLLFRDASQGSGHSVQSRETLGSLVGTLYSRNALGCVIGAVFGGYLSLFVLDLPGVFKGVLVSTSLSALLAAAASRHGSMLLKGILPCTALVLTFVMSPWPQAIMGMGTFRSISASPFTYDGFDTYYALSVGAPTILAYDDDPNSTIVVSGHKEGQKGIIVNGKSDGITRGADRVTTLMVGHVPALLQSSTSNQVAVIGFGTGITSGALARHDEFTGVHVLEISDAVQRFAPFFDTENGHASKSPKLKWHHGDAYRYLLSTRTLYGVIASEPSNPWVGGVERLYSQEFYQISRSKLAPGGLFAQWFHRYSISNETLTMVLKTFSSVFPKMYLFETGMDLILIGSETPLERKNLELLSTRMKRPEIQQDLKDMGITSLNNLLGRELWIGQQNFPDTPIHTLLHPQLSFAAGKDFFLNSSSDIRRLNQLPPYHYAARQGMLQSLTATQFFHSDRKTFLDRLITFYCNQPSAQFFTGWERSSSECQVALISSLTLGFLTPPQNIGKEFIENLRALSHTSLSLVKPAENPEAAVTVINYAIQFGAPFIQPSAENLRRIAEVCLLGEELKHLRCQSQLATALLTNGYTDLALEEYANLMKSSALLQNRPLLHELKSTFKGLL